MVWPGRALSAADYTDVSLATTTPVICPVGQTTHMQLLLR